MFENYRRYVRGGIVCNVVFSLNSNYRLPWMEVSTDQGSVGI